MIDVIKMHDMVWGPSIIVFECMVWGTYKDAWCEVSLIRPFAIGASFDYLLFLDRIFEQPTSYIR